MHRKQHIEVHSEFLILPGGRILAHNLTPTMARLLAELNRRDEIMSRRAFAGRPMSPRNIKRSTFKVAAPQPAAEEASTSRAGARRSKHA